MFIKDPLGFGSSSLNRPDSKVLGANMGPIWVRQDPGGPHIGPINFDIWAGKGPDYHIDWTCADVLKSSVTTNASLCIKS